MQGRMHLLLRGGGRNHGCQIAKEFLTKLKAVEKQHGGGNSKTIIFFKMRICLLKRMKKFSPTFTSFQDKTVAFNSGIITEICGKMYALTWQQWLWLELLLYELDKKNSLTIALHCTHAKPAMPNSKQLRARAPSFAAEDFGPNLVFFRLAVRSGVDNSRIRQLSTVNNRNCDKFVIKWTNSAKQKSYLL